MLTKQTRKPAKVRSATVSFKTNLHTKILQQTKPKSTTNTTTYAPSCKNNQADVAHTSIHTNTYMYYAPPPLYVFAPSSASARLLLGLVGLFGLNKYKKWPLNCKLV